MVIGTMKRFQCIQAKPAVMSRARLAHRNPMVELRSVPLSIYAMMPPSCERNTPPTKASSRMMLGRAMRRLRVKNSASSQAVTATPSAAKLKPMPRATAMALRLFSHQSGSLPISGQDGAGQIALAIAWPIAPMATSMMITPMVTNISLNPVMRRKCSASAGTASRVEATCARRASTASWLMAPEATAEFRSS